MEVTKEEVPKKTLQELEEEHLSELINCFILVWQSNPTRNCVKLYLDGGENTFYLKRDRFVEMISDILYSSRNKEVLKIIAMIKTSLDDYGNYFEFNKQTQQIRQLSSIKDVKKEIQQELSRNNKKDQNEFVEEADMNVSENIADMDMKDNLRQKTKKIPTKRRFDVGDYRKKFL